MTRETGPHRPHVVLVGPPGAGKSTIGRKLARELGAELVDTDAVIEAETGRSIPEIFAADGEPEFRRIEEDVVRRAVQAADGIVSLGGGAILSTATRQLLRDRTVVYLEISVAEGLRRTGAATHRPLLAAADPSAKYRELMQIRRPLYREVASVRVRTDGRSPGRVVRNILARLGLEPVEQVVTPPRPAETSGAPAARRARRRRRGGRSRGANKAADQAISTAPQQSEADAPREPAADSAEPGTSRPTAAGDATTTRRSRRSRRGGRRRSKGQRTTEPPTGTTESTAAQPVPGQAPTTSTPRRRGTQRTNPAAPQQVRAGQSRSGTRTTPRPTTETATDRESSAPARTPGARRSRAARRPAGPPTPTQGPDPAARPAIRTDDSPARPAPESTRPAPDTTAGHRDSEDSSQSGRDRWDRARRAHTLRAQQESEQTA